MTADAIVAQLAESTPTYLENPHGWHYTCVFCDVTKPEVSVEDHSPDCVWRLAVEHSAAAQPTGL